MLTSQIPRLNRKNGKLYTKQIKKLFGQFEAYAALTLTSIGMRRQK